MNLIMLAALAAQPIELLNIAALFVVKLKRRFLATSTWDHMEAMMNRRMEGFHEIYAFPMLVFLCMCAYATLTPLLLIFSAVYYAMGYVVYLNQLLYVYNVPCVSLTH